MFFYCKIITNFSKKINCKKTLTQLAEKEFYVKKF